VERKVVFIICFELENKRKSADILKMSDDNIFLLFI